MNFRKIIKEDNIPLAAIIRGVFVELDIPRTGTVYDDPATDHLFEIFQTPKSVLWVAEENLQPIGCCGIFPTEGLPERYAELVKLYLSKTDRHKGIGRTLFEKSIQSALAFGYTHLYLESFPQLHDALNMYEKQGFQREVGS